MRGLIADRRFLRWLIGASVAWFLFDLVYYGNTISSPLIVKLVAPHASLITQTAYVLAIFAVFALPAYLLAAWTIDRLGRRIMQTGGFVLIGPAFFGLWLIPGATTTVGPFIVLFGATYFFSEFDRTPRHSSIPPRSSPSGSARPATVRPQPPARSEPSSEPTP
jgi:PHS family inorganic phosphate transporter-like MFS transporter